MSDSIAIGRRASSLSSAPQFLGYSRVIIVVSDEVEYSAGTDTGRTLVVENPWGTQEMANQMLEKIKGFQYQPFKTQNAIADPAAEMGDGVSVGDVYSGIYSMDTTFGIECRAKISAPSDEEIDHEYPYVPRQERHTTRTFRDLKSELKVQAGLISAEVEERKSQSEIILAQLNLQAGEISAKVSKTGGDFSEFGWVMDDTSWTIKANGSDILKATKDGLEVYGKVTATSGKIGGFDITFDSLSYNNQIWGGTNTIGIYVGPSGIQLGKNFRVDAAGNLNASSGEFSGYVRAGSILHGDDYGTLHASALTGHSISGSQIKYNTISTAYTSGGINTSLGYADFANGVFNGFNTASLVNCASMIFNGKTVARQTMTLDGKTIKYLGWVG